MNTELEELQQDQPKLNLSVNVDQTSACGRHVTVTIPREDIERYFSDQFDDLVPKAEVPGFRPGKAPRKLVEKKFRKQLSDQVKGQLIMDSLAQVSETEDFSAISEPDLDYEQVKIPEEGDFRYEFNIEVRPEFEVPKYKGLELTRPEHEFTDDDVNDHIKSLGQLHGDLVPVDEPVQAGDVVICKVTTRQGDQVISTHDEVSLQVRSELDASDGVVKDFDKLMVGAKADDKKTTKVTLSDFADNESLRGQEVEVEFEVLDVKRVEEIAADEMVEKTGVASLEELQNSVRQMLEQRLQYAQRQTIRDQISAALTESADWSLPEDLLQRQSRREMQRAVMEMRSSGFSEPEIVARENQLRKDVNEKTATLLKEHFILERIAEAESIEDQPQDYELEIAKIAIQQNDSPRRVRSRLERTGQMDSLRNMIIEQKVIDVITSEAKFKGTDYQFKDDQSSTSVNIFFGGRKQVIPEAKYDGGEAPAIPGMDK